MKHKMEQQHSQPSQDSQQPLLAASPAAASLTGHHNPHLSLSKCNSGATDTIEVIQHPNHTHQILTQTVAGLAVESAHLEPQQLRKRKTVNRPSNDVHLRLHQMPPQHSFEQIPLPDSNVCGEHLTLESLAVLPPPPIEFDWPMPPTQTTPLRSYANVSNDHQLLHNSSLGSTMLSLPSHLLARSAALPQDAGPKKKSAMKGQRKSSSLHQLQQQHSLSVYPSDPITVSFETSPPGSLRHASPVYPVKPSRRPRAQPLLQHQQAIASNESLLQTYQSPAHLNHIAGVYSAKPIDRSNRSTGDLMSQTGGILRPAVSTGTGSVPLRSALKPPHSSAYSGASTSRSFSQNPYYDRTYRG